MTVAIIAGSLVVPVFADSLNYEEEARTLYDLGLFKGVSETEYKPNLEARLLREEAVALLLRMFKLEDEALSMDENEAKQILSEKFKDADQIASWAVKYVAYAVKNGIIAGRPDGNFAPKDNLLGREYAKMLLTMLGYVQGKDFEYEFSMSELANVSGFPQKEAVALDTEYLLRDDVVGMSYYTLTAEYVAGENAGKKVIEVIVGDDEEMRALAIEKGLIEKPVMVLVEELPDIEITQGDELVLPETVKVTYSDGTVKDVKVSWPNIDTNEPREKTEITGVLEGSDGKLFAKFNLTIKEAALRVTGVSATNLVEVVVTFNNDVSGNSAAAKADNYSLSKGTIDSVTVNGNIVVLSLKRDNVPANQTAAKLTVNEKILPAKETFDFTFFDRELPEVLGLEATGPKEFTITFSEPIQTKGTVSIKTGSSTLSVNYNEITLGTAKVKVPLYSSLTDGKDYEVTIQGFSDYAGYNNVVKTITYSYVKDTSAPVAEIETAKQEYVVVKFNKPVKGIIKEMFSHTFSAWTATKVTEDEKGEKAIDPDRSYDKVYVWFYTGNDKEDKPIPEGEVSFRILGKATREIDKKDFEIKDLWDNKFETATFTLSVAADKTIPDIKEIKVTAEDAFTIEFTKKVSFTKDNIEILDSEGKKIDGLTWTVSPSSADTKFTVTLSKGQAGKTLVVNIKNVYDATLNSNKLDLYSTTLDITDKKAPVVSYVRWDGGDYIYVFFNEDVDEATALNVNNYMLYNNDGTFTKLTGATSFFEGTKIVKINVKDQKLRIKANETKLFVTGVKDLAGNEIEAGTTDKPIQKIADNKAEMTEANATAPNTIEVFFNARLGLVDKDAFTIHGVSDVAIANMEEQLKDGNTKLVLTLSKDMTYDASGVSVEITPDGAKLLKDLFDETVKSKTVTVNDKIAPAIDKVEQDIENNEAVIKLTFKEKVKTTTTKEYAAKDLVILDKDGKELVAGIDYQIVAIHEGSGNSNTNEIRIELLGSKAAYRGKLTVKTADTVQYITDNAGNKLASFSKEITMENRSYGVDQDPGKTGGDGLDYKFEKGVLTIKMKEKGTPVPFVKGGAPESAYWIGIKIEKPLSVEIEDLGENKDIEITVNGKKFYTDEDEPGAFWYYFNAGEEEKTEDTTVSGSFEMTIKWNSKYTETIKVEYNVKVAGSSN